MKLRSDLEPMAERDFVGGRAFAAARALIQLGYFSFEVEGLAHVPREGPVVFAQNHSGWFPLDAFAVMLAIGQGHGLERVPFYATHEAALATPLLGPWLRRFGAVPAGWFRRPERLPRRIQALGIFPEGVEGNCKPFWNAYRMRPWNRGFVRVAAAWGAPIVPVAILGGEECLPVAWTVRVLEPVIGSVVGLPLFPLPLPSSWKVIFHEPMRLEARRGPLAAHARAAEIAARVRDLVQRTLDREAEGRALWRLSRFVNDVTGAPPPGTIEDPLDDAGPEPAHAAEQPPTLAAPGTPEEAQRTHGDPRLPVPGPLPAG